MNKSWRQRLTWNCIALGKIGNELFIRASRVSHSSQARHFVLAGAGTAAGIPTALEWSKAQSVCSGKSEWHSTRFLSSRPPPSRHPIIRNQVHDTPTPFGQSQLYSRVDPPICFYYLSPYWDSDVLIWLRGLSPPLPSLSPNIPRLHCGCIRSISRCVFLNYDT